MTDVLQIGCSMLCGAAMLGAGLWAYIVWPNIRPNRRHWDG